MKKIKEMKNIIRDFAICILIFFFISANKAFSQSAKTKSNDWQKFYENEFIEFNYRYDDCYLSSQESHHEYVYLKLINKTEDSIIVDWVNEYWYGERCKDCEDKIKEFKSSIKLKGGETAEGICSDEFKRDLRILSRILDLPSRAILSDFNLREIKVIIADL